MEIKEHIESKIEDFLVSRLNKLIDNEDYFFSKITNKKFGHYDISIKTDYVQVVSRSTKFYFEYEETLIIDKTFLGFKKLFFIK